MPTDAHPTRRPLAHRVAVALTGLLLFAVSVPEVCRVLGTDVVAPLPDALLPQALAFLPWLILPAAVALLASAALRWRPGLLWALAVVLLLAWCVRPYGVGAPVGGYDDAAAGTAREHPGAHLIVLTSNVEFGAATPALIALVKERHPDLLFVEECSLGCAHLLDVELPKAAYPYRDLVREDGSKGSAILSRFPLTPTGTVPGVMGMPAADALIDGRTVALQLAHPVPPLTGQVPEWRRELGRLRAAADTTRERGVPALVAGDFNATRDHAAFRALLGAGGLGDAAVAGGAGGTPSWPADVLPRPLGIQIDHVLVSRDLTVRDARFLDLPDTDHRALLVRVDLRGRSGEDRS